MADWKNDREAHYLIADELDTPLARAVLESPADGPTCQLRLLEGDGQELAKHEVLQLVPMSGSSPPLSGKVVRSRGRQIVLEKKGMPLAELRRNLRIPVAFHSFIYPLTGRWKGRRTILSEDISCGGIAFYCEEALEDGEEIEVVVPVCSQPLILRAQVLRTRLTGGRVPLYACKFLELLPEEESMVREAVFGIQLKNRHLEA